MLILMKYNKKSIYNVITKKLDKDKYKINII